MAHLASYVGCTWIAPVDDAGAVQGPWVMVGEAYPLSLQLSDGEPVTITGRTCLTRGKTIGSKHTPGEATGSLTLHEYTAYNVALALKGQIEQVDETAASLTDEEVALFAVGEWTLIGAAHLDSVTVTNSGGTALVEGTDYQINKIQGLIAPLTAAVANSTVKITATGTAYKATRVRIGAKTNQKFAIRSRIINEFTDAELDLYLRKCMISSNAEINWISDADTDHETLALSLTPEIPTGADDYGYVDGLPLAA